MQEADYARLHSCPEADSSVLQFHAEFVLVCVRSYSLRLKAVSPSGPQFVLHTANISRKEKDVLCTDSNKEPRTPTPIFIQTQESYRRLTRNCGTDYLGLNEAMNFENIPEEG